jgi:hypothetical protein
MFYHLIRVRDIVVGTAVHYGLDEPGIEYQHGQIFRTRPDQPWGPKLWVPRLFAGGKVSKTQRLPPNPI